MALNTIHTINAPLSAAAARMPALVRTDLSLVRMERAPQPLAWKWSAGGASGAVQLSPLSATTTRLEIAVDGPASMRTADALTVELYGVLERQWAPASAASGSGLGGRAKVALATVVVLAPLLAVTGMRVLAPPAPMDVATAVAQFRQQNGEPSAVGTGARGGAGKAKRRLASQDSATRGPQTRQRDASETAAEPNQQRAGNRAAVVGPPDSATATPAGGRQAEPPAPQRAPRKAEPFAISPEEGVYRYATQGYESIDRPSSRHDYPRETAISIRATDCGFSARWQPLENRWDEMSVCRQDGEAFLPGLSTHREFFGQENDSNYRCGPDNYAYRPRPGATWTGRCVDGGGIMQVHGRTLGIEPVRVGDEIVETVHYSLEARISGGDARGKWTAERWVDPDTGLLVRVEAQTRATSHSSVGTVQYQEELSLLLVSTTPER